MLIIAEKPKMGQAIATALGIVKKQNGYVECRDAVVTWCVGHMLELATPEAYTAKKQWLAEDLPILPQEWKVVESKDLKTQLNVIKTLLKKTDVVVHAGDHDREGQLIVDEVLRFLNYKKKVVRLLINDLSAPTIVKAMQDLQPNEKFQHLSEAALTRSKIDWLYGMNLTRGFTLAYKAQGGKEVRSYGRVQTPVLALVVNRDRQRENFKPVLHYTPTITVNHPKGTWGMRWTPDENDERLVDGLLLDAGIGQQILSQVGSNGVLTKARYEQKDVPAPQLYSLSALQEKAGRALGMGAKAVLDTCQALYEKKLTSYPRTDCRFVPEAQHVEASQVLASIAQYPNFSGFSFNPALKSPAWNSSKVTAHHAIIPVSHQGQVTLTTEESQIFQLICQSYAQQFLPAKRVEQRQVQMDNFTASCTVTLSPGWDVWKSKSAGQDDTGHDGTDSADSADTGSIPPGLQVKDGVQVVGTELKSAQTSPPAAFTEGKLITAMTEIHKYVQHPEIKKRLRETAGLGTEATRASIIETLKSRGYVEVKKKQIVSTPAGRAFIDAVPLELKDPGMTALWEQALDEIAKGERTAAQFLSQQEKILPKQVELALQTHFGA